jgi:hypothetical protein
LLLDNGNGSKTHVIICRHKKKKRDLQIMCRIIRSLVSGRLVNGHDLFICMKWVKLSNIRLSSWEAHQLLSLLGFYRLNKLHFHFPFFMAFLCSVHVNWSSGKCFFWSPSIRREEIDAGLASDWWKHLMLFWSTNLHNFLITSDWRQVNCIISCSLFCR